jgi:hypothetical protein
MPSAYKQLNKTSKSDKVPKLTSFTAIIILYQWTIRAPSFVVGLAQGIVLPSHGPPNKIDKTVHMRILLYM